MGQQPYAGESQIVEDEFSELKAKSLLKGKKGLIKTLPVLKKDGKTVHLLLYCVWGRKEEKEEALRMKKRLRGE